MGLSLKSLIQSGHAEAASVRDPLNIDGAMRMRLQNAAGFQMAIDEEETRLRGFHGVLLEKSRKPRP